MGLHSDTTIYKTAYQLTGVVILLARQMPRDVKKVIGESIRDECLQIVKLIFKANVAADKRPYLLEIIERVAVVEVLLRQSRDLKFVSIKGYAKAAFLTTSVSKQANGWRRSPAASPAT